MDFVFQFCLILYITTQPYPQITRYHEEKYYTNKRTGKKEEFPSLEDKWTVNLSIIVPAYNEEERRKLFLSFQKFSRNVS